MVDSRGEHLGARAVAGRVQKRPGAVDSGVWPTKSNLLQSKGRNKSHGGRARCARPLVETILKIMSLVLHFFLLGESDLFETLLNQSLLEA